MTHDLGATFALAVAKATLILGAGLAADALLRRRSAALRHFVLALTLTAAVAVGLLAPVAPELRLAVPAWPALRAPLAEARIPAWANSGIVDVLPARPSPLPWGGSTDAPDSPLRASLPIWATAWLLGVFVVAGWLVLGHLGLARLARSAAPIDDAGWRTLAASTAARYGIAPVSLLRSASVGSPLTWGVRRPVVLLPNDAASWPVARRSAVLAHELAHVARRDIAWQLLSGAACAMYWFHPLAWWTARRLREESERACDDSVLARGTNAADYATHLLDVARGSRGLRLAGLVAIGMARPSHLEGRLLAVLDDARARHAPRPSTRLAAFATVAVLVLAIAGLTPAPRAATTSTEDDESDAGASQFERSVDAKPGEELEIRLDAGGDVSVEGWDKPSVQVRGRLGGRDWRDTDVKLEKVAGGVRLETKQHRSGNGSSTSHDFEIHVPRRYDIELRSAGGDLTLHDVDGTFRGNTGGGDMEITNVNGRAELNTGGGDIEVTDCDLKGSVTTGGGEVTLTRVRGGLHGASGGGHVRTRAVDESGKETGPLVISDSGGDIELDHVPNDATLSTGGGDIDVGRVDGSITATTGGGDVNLGPVAGSVETSTGAGDVSVWITGKGDKKRSVRISSGTGAILVELPPDIGATVELESAYTNNFRRPTKIESDWPLERTGTSNWDDENGTPRKYVRAHGDIGGGGMLIKVRTVNGDVAIRKRKA